MRFLAAILALVCGPALAGSAELTCTAPTENTDGSRLDDLASFRFYWGTSPGSLPFMDTIPATATCAYDVGNLPNGTWYFAATALNMADAESVLSNLASKVISDPVLAPGPVLNPTVALAVAPPATITLRFDTAANPDQPQVIIPAGVTATLTLLGGQRWDWLKTGAAISGQGGTVVPTVPALGQNNDGIDAATITVTGPVDALADTDPNAFQGADVTVAGITKRLTQSGNAWTVSFP